jgi:hypothetical protein
LEIHDFSFVDSKQIKATFLTGFKLADYLLIVGWFFIISLLRLQTVNI